MSTRLLRLSEVRTRVPFSRATIYAKISQGLFPRPINLGGGGGERSRAVAWLESDIEAWIASRVEASLSGHTEAGK